MARPLDHAQLYRVLTESAPDAIITIDEHSIVLSVNPAAERIFGYAAEEIVGQPLAMLMPARMHAGHAAGMGRYLATGRRHIAWQGIRVPVQTKAGVEIPVEIAFGEFEADGQRVFSGYLRDISDRVAAEQAVTAARADAERRATEAEALADQLQTQAVELELQTDEAQALAEELEQTNEQLQHALADAEGARAEAERASRAKSEFLATMSHEIRTPVNAIIGYTELLELGISGPVTAEQQAQLERIRVSGRHLTGLVNEVLDLAKIEAHEMAVQQSPEQVGEAADAALALMRPAAAAKHLRLSAQCEGDSAATYVGDAQRVQQILANLLSNAVKFTDPGGAIHVRCVAASEPPPSTGLRAAPWTRVAVEDTGIGIAADALERIFEPFQQVETGYTRTKGGTGLGLTISRRLARLMGGDLVAASQPGQGSTFTLWLPAIPSAAAAAAAAAAALPATTAAAGASPADASLRADVANVATMGDSPAAPRPRAISSADAGTAAPADEDGGTARANRTGEQGFADLGRALRAGIDPALQRYVARLRSDAQFRHTIRVSDELLENHVATFLADVAQSFLLLTVAGAEPMEVLRDGTEIQRVLSLHHGAQRHRLGWTEQSLRSEFEVLDACIGEALAVHAAAAVRDPASPARQQLSRFLSQAQQVSLRGYRHAVATAGSPGAQQ